MQVVDHKNIEKRMLFYWSKLYSSSIKSGQKYDELKRTIIILFSNYNLDILKNIKKYITKWQIREEENRAIVLTEDFVFYIIEIGKFINNAVNTELDNWINFINNPKGAIDMDNKELKKAKEELEKISQDEHERYLADLREKYIRDQMAIEDAGYDKGFKAGIEHGIQRGIQRGIQQGIQQEMQRNIEHNKKIAKALKDKGISIAEICKITDLSEDDVNSV